MFVNLNKIGGIVIMKKQIYDYLIAEGLRPNLSGFELIGSAIEKCSDTYMEKQKDNSHFLKYCNCDYEKRGV